MHLKGKSKRKDTQEEYSKEKRDIRFYSLSILQQNRNTMMSEPREARKLTNVYTETNKSENDQLTTETLTGKAHIVSTYRLLTYLTPK